MNDYSKSRGISETFSKVFATFSDCFIKKITYSKKILTNPPKDISLSYRIFNLYTQINGYSK